MTTYSTITVEHRDNVGVVTLNRPEALNALNTDLVVEITEAVSVLDQDDVTGCIVLAGLRKAFAAGADIKEMQSLSYMDAYRSDWFGAWDSLASVRKPLIAAVSGHALGGGCELAMLCDMIIASETAKFGQPEIKLGVTPGIGGTQRLTRAVGKAKAMEMCLTGRTMDAEEAERSGLVTRVIPTEQLMDDVMETASTIAGMSTPVTMMVKESVNRSFETSLSEGVRFERRAFHASFATEDQKEGMAAFVEKRKPSFADR